jgi:hypothetical protein
LFIFIDQEGFKPLSDYFKKGCGIVFGDVDVVDQGYSVKFGISDLDVDVIDGLGMKGIRFFKEFLDFDVGDFANRFLCFSLR